MLVLALLLQVAAIRCPVPCGPYWPTLQEKQPALLQRELHVAGMKQRRIQTVAREEKRPLTLLEEQRMEQLTDEIRSIEQAILALGPPREPSLEPQIEPPLSTRSARADWFHSSAIWSRLVEPVKTGLDWNMMGRLAVGRVTIASWLLRPMLGHGAGSINRLSTVLPTGRQVQKIWNGNLVLFVLHDSGLLGLAALLGLAVAVCRQGVGAISLGADRAIPSLAVPLLAVGGALCFAYQFTHGLWVMYPYVYLGLLTGATDDASSRL